MDVAIEVISRINRELDRFIGDLNTSQSKHAIEMVVTNIIREMGCFLGEYDVLKHIKVEVMSDRYNPTRLWYKFVPQTEHGKALIKRWGFIVLDVY